MTKDKALKLALEALETCNWVDDGGYGHAEYDHVLTNKAITAIKEAFAQPEQTTNYSENYSAQPEQEPWVCECGANSYLACKCAIKSPPPRQPLSDEVTQIAEALRRHALTLVKTAKGYDVMNLGQITAHGIKGEA